MMEPAERVRRPRLAFAGIAVLAILLALVDNLSGSEFSFSIFYLVPVGMAAWYLGLAQGLALATICCVAWTLNDSILATQHYSHWLIPVWNGVMRGLIFGVVAVLTARVHEVLRREHEARTQLLSAYEVLDTARNEQLVVKDRLLSHVSHELRTPLTALHQVLTILDDGLAGELAPQQKEYLGVALRNADQLRRMIGDLLES